MNIHLICEVTVAVARSAVFGLTRSSRPIKVSGSGHLQPGLSESAGLCSQSSQHAGDAAAGQPRNGDEWPRLPFSRHGKAPLPGMIWPPGNDMAVDPWTRRIEASLQATRTRIYNIVSHRHIPRKSFASRGTFLQATHEDDAASSYSISNRASRGHQKGLLV